MEHYDYALRKHYGIITEGMGNLVWKRKLPLGLHSGYIEEPLTGYEGGVFFSNIHQDSLRIHYR